MPTEIDAGLLTAIRRLRSFTHGCDLEALAKTAGQPLDLLEALIAGGSLDATDAGHFWSRRIGIGYVDLASVIITEEAIAAWPVEIAVKAMALPIYRMGGALTVAMAHPEDAAAVERLAHIAQTEISPVFAFPSELTARIRLHYSTEKSLEASLGLAENMELFATGIDLSTGGKAIARLAESEQVVQFLTTLITFALRRGVSDIHIEPRAGDSLVRYRVDGNLRKVLTFSRKLHASVIARLKIMAELDITETRLPADGRFSMSFGTTRVDFRFSSIPTHCGEKAVVRLLGGTGRRSLLNLDKMMISQSVLKPLRRVLKSPNGIILVTGPTGSGKTTTLYAALAELNDSTVNISTIEDPIEMKLEGISQTQVNPLIDMSFARMLRALLRQDPDIMLVGEIRDLETAKIAAEAALTGHLVLATLHTNSAPEAVVRLEEIGVDPYMIGPTVVAVLSQRLAARICENCKEPYRPAQEVLRKYFYDDPMPEVTFYRGRGCHVCERTGYKGRVAFHELFVVDKELRTKISKRIDLVEIVALARKIGYRSLRYDGLKKVLLGLTTIEEIEAQTPVDIG